MSESVFVPGRVNIIGEHTDYNEGLALAFAVDRGVRIDIDQRSDDETWLHLEGRAPYELGSTEPRELSLDMARAAWKRFPRSGVTLTVTSDLPDGAGMSSSAAYIGALCLALGARGSVLDLAQIVQSCESDVGSHVGLLDQIATLGGRDGAALLIDFARLEFEPVEIPSRWSFTVVHSETSRILAESGYAERRRECHEILQRIGSWSQLTQETLFTVPEDLRARARHIMTENQRVREMVACARRDDIELAGRLINESHASLRDDFAVSTREVDTLVSHLQERPDVHGVRIMGGGFGGCVVALHDHEHRVEVPGHRSWNVRPSDGGLRRVTN